MGETVELCGTCLGPPLRSLDRKSLCSRSPLRFIPHRSHETLLDHRLDRFVELVARGLLAFFQQTWWWHSEESFAENSWERCQFLTDAHFANSFMPTEGLFVNLQTSERRAFANYLRFRCDTNRPESVRERAEWCLFAYTIPVFDPRRRSRSKAISKQIDLMSSNVWNRVSASSKKIEALPFSEYVTLSNGLLPLLHEADAAKLQGAIRRCFDLAITHVSYFERIDLVEALIAAIQKSNDEWRHDQDRQDYEAKMAAQFDAVNKDENAEDGMDIYVLTSSSGVGYRVRFWESGVVQGVQVRQLDQLHAFGSFTLNEFEDIVNENTLDQHITAPSELGLEQIKWLRANPVTFPEEDASTASICVVADTGGRIIGASLAVRLLRASGLKDLHGPHMINFPPVLGKTDQESLHQLVTDAVEAHENLTHIHLDLVAHGDDEGIHLSDTPITAEDFLRLADQHPEITFLITTLACHSGDQAVALERLLQERADEKLSK